MARKNQWQRCLHSFALPCGTDCLGQIHPVALQLPTLVHPEPRRLEVAASPADHVATSLLLLLLPHVLKQCLPLLDFVKMPPDEVFFSNKFLFQLKSIFFQNKFKPKIKPKIKILFDKVTLTIKLKLLINLTQTWKIEVNLIQCITLTLVPSYFIDQS